MFDTNERRWQEKMSRAYKLYIETIGISKEQLNEVVNKRFGWEGEAASCQAITFFCGDGFLCGGRDDETAHDLTPKNCASCN
jgi:hypothetical protein